MAAYQDQPAPVTPDPEQRTQFRDLIRNRRLDLGESLTDFASKAIDPVKGKRVTRGWIHRLEAGETVTPPQVEELRALAAACELPLTVLQDAAGAQFFGVDAVWTESGEARAYVHKLDKIPADQRERLLRLIDSLVPPDVDEG
jgi:transcriptional regulator with XRE-family HTH domain